MRVPFSFDLAVALIACLLTGLFSSIARAQEPAPSTTATTAPAPSASKPTVFHVKYVADATVYIDAGHNADLQEGMKLSVIAPPPDGEASDGVRFRGYPHVAELSVVSVADTSSVCDVVSTAGELKVGQFAYLVPSSVEDRHLAETAKETESYPILVAFTSGDPVDEELHATKVEHINESPIGTMRGRFGFNYGGIRESGTNSTQLGMMIDADFTHIGGTWWNFTGYWRGNLNSSSTNLPGVGNSTLTDLINRTYHLGFTYQNPYSPTTIGVGRLYLPWAPSLSTIDGGYIGRRIGRFTTVGAFGGSTPDPTSWSYNPNQQIAGTFVNLETGDFDHMRLMSTEGVALTSIHWRAARQFLFLENNLTWKRFFSFYNSTQVDAARTSPLPDGGSNPTGVSQSYTSAHVQPWNRVGFGVNYNYFRSLPTFDPRLVGTGLLDKYLFQGFSGDVRVDLPKRISLYTSLGRSKASSDTKNSLNQAYGISFINLAGTGLFLDLHYSKFDSSFGNGQYESISLSKNLSDTLRIQILGGDQKFNSPLSTNTNSKFVNGIVDWTIGRRYFVEGLYGWYNGTTLNYNQWSLTFGYRFGGYRR
jgi:hypothetical protein